VKIVKNVPKFQSQYGKLHHFIPILNREYAALSLWRTGLAKFYDCACYKKAVGIDPPAHMVNW